MRRGLALTGPNQWRNICWPIEGCGLEQDQSVTRGVGGASAQTHPHRGSHRDERLAWSMFQADLLEWPGE